MRRTHNVCKLVVLKVILAMGVVTGMQLLSGCGFLTVEKQTVTYRVPNWMPDGRIVALKQVIITKDNPILGPQPGGTQQWIVVMNEDGSGEGNLLKIDEAYGLDLIEISKSGNYFGYISREPKLKVYSNIGGSWNHILTLDIAGLGITSFKFSPDDLKICLSEAYDEFFIYDLNGAQLVNISDGGSGIWRDNTNLLYYYFHDVTRDQALANYDLNSSTTTTFNVVITPDQYDSNTDKVYGDYGNEIFIYSFGDNTLVTQNISYSPYEYSDFTARHFSPDGNKMVMMADTATDIGIYLLDIQTSALKLIR